MKVNVYVKTCPFQSRLDALSDLAGGILKMDKDIEINIVKDFTFDYADVSIMWGMPKPYQKEGKLSRNRCSIVAGAQFTNTKLLILDMPIFGRKQGVPIQTAEDSYRILEGHALGYGTYPYHSSNRWSKISKKYKINLGKLRTDGIIGIASQRHIDADMFGKNIIEWVGDTVKLIRDQTNDPIGIKAHPKDIEYKNAEVAYSGILNAYKDVYLIDNLDTCKMLYTYTSNISIDALIDGIDVVSCHPANLLHKHANNNRLETLKKLSYVQWSTAEMRSGLAWRHIRSIL